MKHFSNSLGVKILCLSVVLPLIACGCSSSIMTKTERLSAPQSGQAIVNFVRPSMVGGAISFGLWDGDSFVGILMPGTCIQYQTTPGEHYFMARAENWSCVKANLAPDKQYVIKANPVLGVWKARVAFDPIVKADYDKGQLKDAQKWITAQTVMPDPAKRDEYVQPRKDDVARAMNLFKSGGGKFEVMSADDFLPQQ